MTLAPGETFGRYVLESVIGQGGMGQVLRAMDTVLERPVALKVIRPGSEEREEAVKRFFREAKLAAQVRHPNAVEIYDLGEVNGLPFMAMELIEGHSLRTYVGDDSVSVEEKLRWMMDVARGLAAAHKRGLVHRDLKPANIMIAHERIAKVVDFGLAKRTAPSPMLRATFHTMPGFVVGTPVYMAPEQLEGEQVDARADQFAWGLTTYELLSGMNPRRLDLALLDPIAPLASRVPAVSEPVSDVVRQTLAHAPGDRYGSMDAVADALVEALARPRSVLAAQVARTFYCPSCASQLDGSGRCGRCGYARASAVPPAPVEKETRVKPLEAPPPPDAPEPPPAVAAPVLLRRAEWTFRALTPDLRAHRRPLRAADILDQHRILAFGELWAVVFDTRYVPFGAEASVAAAWDDVPAEGLRGSLVRGVRALSDGTFALAGARSLAVRFSSSTQPNPLRPAERGVIGRWTTPERAELVAVAAADATVLVFVGHRQGHGIAVFLNGFASTFRELDWEALSAVDIGLDGRIAACGPGGAFAFLDQKEARVRTICRADLTAAAVHDGGAFVGGKGGFLANVSHSGEVTVESTTTASTITALTWDVDAGAWAGTDSGRVMRRDLDGRWHRAIHDTPQPIVALRAKGAWVVAVAADGAIFRGFRGGP